MDAQVEHSACVLQSVHSALTPSPKGCEDAQPVNEAAAVGQVPCLPPGSSSLTSPHLSSPPLPSCHILQSQTWLLFLFHSALGRQEQGSFPAPACSAVPSDIVSLSLSACSLVVQGQKCPGRLAKAFYCTQGYLSKATESRSLECNA